MSNNLSSSAKNLSYYALHAQLEEKCDAEQLELSVEDCFQIRAVMDQMCSFIMGICKNRVFIAHKPMDA